MLIVDYFVLCNACIIFQWFQNDRAKADREGEISGCLGDKQRQCLATVQWREAGVH
jgi:hypothetical protein